MAIKQLGAAPTNDPDAATKKYVDDQVAGIGSSTNNVTLTARLATAAALPSNTYLAGVLTGVGLGALTVDGVAVAVNNIILVKNEASGLKNGLYTVTVAGSAGAAYVLTRHTSMDVTGEFVGAVVPVGPEGTANKNTEWRCTNATAPTVGTTAITFEIQYLGAATATSINKVAFTAPTTAATFAFGTDNTTQTFQGTDTIVGRATTDTLTNKTLTAPKINEAVAVTATSTELNYTDGVTSAIQTQLDAKQPLDSDLTTISSLTATTDNFMVATASAWASRTPSQARTQMGLGSIAVLAAPSGAVVGTTDTQTLTNKTLTTPIIGIIHNSAGAPALLTGGGSSDVNRIQIVSRTTGNAPYIVADGSDTNIDLSLLGKGTGAILANNIPVATIYASQTLTNKDISSSTNTFPTGMAVQQVSTLSTAVATGTTVIPADDTIPQNTEGDEYMTRAITPKSTTNRLVIEVNVFASSSIATQIAVALFQDTTANALAATAQWQHQNGGMVNLKLTYEMAAGTTSSTTFKVRAGGHAAGTTTFNGTAGARLFGGITKSSIVIFEYKA